MSLTHVSMNHRLVRLLVILAALAGMLCLTAGAPAQAATLINLPPPLRTIHAAAGIVQVYDRNQVLNLPGVQQRKVRQARSVTLPHLSSGLSGGLTVGASITWVFANGMFVCGFLEATSSITPSTVSVDEIATLYINGDAYQTIDGGGRGSIWASTACYSGPALSWWHGRVDAYGSSGGAILVHGWADVYGLQPETYS